MTVPHLLRVLLELPVLFCELCAALGIVYTLFASFLIGRFFAHEPSSPKHYPGVTIVKPLHGDEWNLVEHLASFVEQDYPGPIQYLFGVHDREDAALEAVDQLRARYPQAQIRIVADARLYGPNRKIANLVNMLKHAEHDVLCFADSDVSVNRNYLGHIVGALQEPGVGLVTSVYSGLPAPGVWPRFAAAAINYHFLPGVITGLFIGRARPCFGQTIAMTREMLSRIGGLAQFAHHLAEDFEIGEAVRRTGATVAIPPCIVQHACVEDTFTRLAKHELRWSRTIRAADRAGHLGSALMHPLPFAVFAVLLSGGAASAWMLAGASLLARAWLVLRADRAIDESRSGLWCFPICDLIQFAVYVASFFSSRVIWRGRYFRVDASGLLTPVFDDSSRLHAAADFIPDHADEENRIR